MFVHYEQKVTFLRFFDPKSSCLTIELSLDYILLELETSFHKSIHYFICHRLIHFVTASVADKNRTVFTFFQNTVQLFCDLFHFVGKFVDVVNIRQVIVKFTLAVLDNVGVRWVCQTS